MGVDEFLDKLDNVTKAGAGHVARCPAHEDRNNSLSINEGEGGRIILKCHTGCEAQSVVQALGLKLSDLFPASVFSFEPEATYSYRDLDGNELFQALRMPGKKFSQRHYDAANPDAKENGWVWNLDGVTRVPYRLPELVEGVTAGKGIWICEGEKDVESLVAAGKVATCNPGGAGPGKWRSEFCPFFVGANVTIIADKDEPGRAHANRIKDMLTPFAANIRILQAKTGKDATDHLEAGHSTDEFMPVREAPRRGIVTAQQLAEEAIEALDKTEIDLPGYQMLENCPIIMRPGRVYALGAYTSDGKTTIAAQIARRLLSIYSTKVGYYTLEMPESDIRNKLLSHKGIPLRMLESPWLIKENPEMLQRFRDGVMEISDWNLDVIFNTKANAAYIAQTSVEREHEFIIIDHIHRFSSGGDRGKLEQEIQTITNLALDANIPVLMLCQLRKTTRGKDMVSYPKPSLQEFRETSVIGDDSAMAMALWRQRDASGMKFMSGTELTILKNRFTTGRQDAAGTVFFPQFDLSTQLFDIRHGGNLETEDAGYDGEGTPDEPVDWSGSIFD